MTRRSRAAARSQRGIAAIEFAMVAIALVGCLHLIATFGVMLYTQQVLSRAAADGAMAISSASRSYEQAAIKEVVFTSLARSLVVPPGTGVLDSDHAARLVWVRQAVAVEFSVRAAGVGLPGIELKVDYPYAAHAVLPSFPPLNFIVPEVLSARAVVAVSP